MQNILRKKPFLPYLDPLEEDVLKTFFWEKNTIQVKLKNAKLPKNLYMYNVYCVFILQELDMARPQKAN